MCDEDICQASVASPDTSFFKHFFKLKKLAYKVQGIMSVFWIDRYSCIEQSLYLERCCNDVLIKQQQKDRKI